MAQLTSLGETMVRLEGGSFRMGSERFYPEEAPVRDVEVASFRIDRAPVTTRQFAAFVKATGYVTLAERPLDLSCYPGADPKRLKPGAMVFRALRKPSPSLDWRLWWHYQRGASWRKPEGLRTVFAGRLDHPVTCVAYEDAYGYARWAGKRLPSEAEWEFAARGGLDGADYAWGDTFASGLANVWQGRFPVDPNRRRVWRTTAVGSFPPNDYGLVDMIGNVWEWTSDWYRFGAKDAAEVERCCATRPPDAAFDPSARAPIPSRVVKGGSFLCSADYCARYRPAARQPQMIDTAAGHIGFRCASDD